MLIISLVSKNEKNSINRLGMAKLKVRVIFSIPVMRIENLGVEVETVEDVLYAERRLANAELDTTGIEETICCFAEKTETWVTDPDDLRWEWYVKKNDNEKQFENIVLNKTVDDKAR